MARKKKPPAQLDREIASTLAAQGQPQLAAIFADPEARRMFAQEMRLEIYKKQASAQAAAFKAARPYSVKRPVMTRMADGTERPMRELVGNFETEDAARARADAVGGWVELRADDRVIYGAERRP